MRYVAFVVAYDGGAWSGSQRLTNGRSVQGELERALEQVLKTTTTITLAGRTDAGVHATGQVGKFATENRLPTERVPLALNPVLESTVRIVRAWDVDDGFHPRFSAKSRTYRYTFECGEVPNPLLSRIAGHARHPLNVDAMNDAAQLLVGEHDFAAWQSAGSPNGPTIRRMLRLEVGQGEAFGTPLVEVTLEANAFLYGMARNITGALWKVGRGELERDTLMRLHEGRDRTKCPPPARASGLCLTEVKF